MGFKRRTYTLTFEGDFEGLEVVTKPMSVETWLYLTGQSEDADDQTEKTSAERGAEGIRLFADALVSWNLEEEDGTPVPTTREAIHDQEMKMIDTIVGAWTNAAAKVADPLPETSSDGEQSLEASIPMATPSESPEPSSVPA